MAKVKKYDTETVKAALYIRVSSRQQAEEGYSLEAQERKLKAFCEMQGYEVYGTYRDEGISGKKINRPELQRMLGDVKAGKVHKVIVVKLDRISRNTRDMLNLVEELSQTNTAFICVNDNIDTSTATGKMFLTILSAVAQFESDIGKERTLTAKEELSRQGKFAGGNIPFGYDYDKENKEFAINEAEEPIVTRIFTDYVTGKPANRIATELNAEGVKTKRKGIWQAKQVLTILGNRFYTGFLGWEGIINKGEHEAIISEWQFNKAQRMLAGD